MKYHTTLKQLRDNNACKDRYEYLVKHGNIHNDKTEITLEKILKTNGIEDAIWALRAVNHKAIERDARLFACCCAMRAVKHYPEKKDVLLETINIAISYAKGNATEEEMAAARDAAGAAALAAARDAALAAAWDAALAAARDAAGAAALAAARDAAGAAALAAALDAAGAAALAAARDAAGDVAWDAAWDAAAAEKKAQTIIYKKYFCTKGEEKK